MLYISHYKVVCTTGSSKAWKWVYLDSYKFITYIFIYWNKNIFLNQLDLLSTTSFSMWNICLRANSSHTSIQIHLETAIVLFRYTWRQRSLGYKLTRRCREPWPWGAQLTKKQKGKTQHKCPPGARLLRCPPFLQGWDTDKAKQTVHCKQLFQPSGPGHRGFVHRERWGVGGEGTDGNTLNTSD